MKSSSRFLVFSSALLLLSETASTEPVFPSPPVWDVSEDTDQDGLRDEDEMLLFGMDPLEPADGLADDDGDGLTTAEEFFYQTDPDLADTDGDTWNDGDELMVHTTDPLDPQSFPQGDGIQNPDTTESSDSFTNFAPQTLAALEQETTPASLSDGDFNGFEVNDFRFHSGKDYQGKTFDWGTGVRNTGGWVAYEGSNIEVWKSGGEQFIELDGWVDHCGVKQAIKNPAPGSYVLTWQHSGRTNLKAGNNSYTVKVYYLIGKEEIEVATTGIIDNVDSTKWTPNGLGFSITQEQIAAAGDSDFYVAFIPTNNDTYGTLIDKVRLVSVEFEDINDHANESDDVAVIRWDFSKEIANENIAWIDSHTSEDDVAPRMPQLEFRMHGLADGLTVEVKLDVQYQRGNGARGAEGNINLNLAEDRVRIPADGDYIPINGNTWEIYKDVGWQRELMLKGFFGGDATLTYQIKHGENVVVGPMEFNFRIGGHNPDPARAKLYIESLQDAGPEGSIWFAYPVAKAESKNYNGNNTRYNQFLQLPRDENDTNFRQRRITHAGRPLWGNDGGTTPGGYGMFQVTGSAADAKENIPRAQIWNWQSNATAALEILRSKHQESVQKMALRRQECLNERNQAIAVPDHSVPRREGDPGTMLGDATDGVAPNPRHLFIDTDVVDAVTIKRYNGVVDIAPGTTTGTGDYCVWRNQTPSTQGRWEFRRWRVRIIDGSPQVEQVSYVDIVAEEIE